MKSERAAGLARVFYATRQPQRARVFVVSPSGYVALIERHRRGMHYWAVPGGRIEPGESPADAARREIGEELGLDVILERLIDRRGAQLFYLARVPAELDLSLSGPERLRNRPGDSYKPVWVPIATAATRWLRPPGRRRHWHCSKAERLSGAPLKEAPQDVSSAASVRKSAHVRRSRNAMLRLVSKDEFPGPPGGPARR